MSDRELLELAAKAAGVVVTDKSNPVSLYVASDRCKTGVCWNPIANDGDAFRLMNKLHLSPRFYGSVIEVCQHTDTNVRRVIDHQLNANCDDDAATRRAIVRAAAEIGKAMK